MTAGVFAFSPKGGYCFQSQSLIQYILLPKPLQALLDAEKIAKIYSLTLGHAESFFVAYRDNDGTDHAFMQGLPAGLSEWILATGDDGVPIRDFPSLRVTLGPYNDSFYADDVSSIRSNNLPADLEASVKAAMISHDYPRVVALGANDSYFTVSTTNAASWQLNRSYAELGDLLEALCKEGKMDLISDVYLDPHRLGNCVLQATNGNVLFGNLPLHTAPAAVEAAQSLKRDFEAQTLKTKQDLASQQARQYSAALARQRSYATKSARRMEYARLFAGLVSAGLGVMNAVDAFDGSGGSYCLGFNGFDPTAFWAPIIDAASMPIQ